MNWDKQYIGSHLMIDMEPAPAVGDHADLTKLDYEFRVEITAIEGDSFTGIVRVIGPLPAIEAAGVHRDEVVSFTRSNIKALHRKGDA